MSPQAPRQRVRVLGADAAVGGPARVPDAGRRQRLALRRGVLQLAEVAHRADLGELPVLHERKAGGVIAAVLEPLEAVQEDRLCHPGSDVSDDPAHRLNIPRFSGISSARKRDEPGLLIRSRRRVRSAELGCYERRDASTETVRFRLRGGFREHPYDGLCPRWTHENTAVRGELGVEPLDLREQRR